MAQRTVKAVVVLALLMAVLAGAAQASVQVIGTADINGMVTGCNLIYDTGGDGLSPFVWLDYSQAVERWVNQGFWASSLNTGSSNDPGYVTYYLNPGISMNWGGNWSLPTTIDDASSSAYPPAAGSSQMAHLYYTDLGNTSASGLANKGPFINLVSDYYWSGTNDATNEHGAWAFSTDGGHQNSIDDASNLYALAVRPGQLEVVPEPSTYLLLGIALGVVGYARRRMSAR